MTWAKGGGVWKTEKGVPETSRRTRIHMKFDFQKSGALQTVS